MKDPFASMLDGGEGLARFYGLLLKQMISPRLTEALLHRAGPDISKNSNEDNRMLAVFFLRMAKFVNAETFLQGQEIKDCVDLALQRNDKEFFKAMGRVVDEGPTNLEMPGKLEMFLCQHWDGKWIKMSGGPPLNQLNRESLAVVCAHVLKVPDEQLSADAVEKTRQRIGLTPASGPKVKVIKLGNRLKIVP